LIAEGRRFNPGRRLNIIALVYARSDYFEFDDMAAGSWPRLIIGLLLALEVVRMQIMGGTSMIALALAAIFIILTAVYFVFRF